MAKREKSNSSSKRPSRSSSTNSSQSSGSSSVPTKRLKETRTAKPPPPKSDQDKKSVPASAKSEQNPPPVNPEASWEARRKKLVQHRTPLQQMVLNRPAYIGQAQLEVAYKMYPTVKWKEDDCPSLHGESVMHRMAAVREVLVQAASTGTQFTVQHFYPANRELGYQSRDGKLIIHDVRPTRLPLLQGDRTVVCPPSDTADRAMMVDIYKLGADALNAQNLATALGSPRPVDIITRRHDGECGVNVDEVWYRDPQGLIHSKPPGEGFWPAHPSFSLDQEHGRHVHFPNGGEGKYVVRVTYKRDFGPFKWYQVDWSPFDPTELPMDPFRPVEGLVVKRYIEYKVGWIQFWRNGLKQLGDGNLSFTGPEKREVYVYLPALVTLSTHRGRIGHGPNLDVALTTVRAQLTSDPRWKLFAQEFPELTSQIILETASYAVYGNRLRDVDAMSADRQGTGQADLTLATLRGSSYKPEAETWWRRFYYCKVFGALFLLVALMGYVSYTEPEDDHHPSPFTNSTKPQPFGRPGLAIGLALEQAWNTTFPPSESPSDVATTAPSETTTPPSTHKVGPAGFTSREEDNLDGLVLTVGQFAFTFVFVLLCFGFRRPLKRWKRNFSEGWRANYNILREEVDPAWSPMTTVPVPRVECVVPQIPETPLRSVMTITQAGVPIFSGKELTPEVFNALSPSQQEQPGWWPLGASTESLMAPARSVRSVVTALANRNLKDNGIECEGPAVDARWSGIVQKMIDAGVFPIYDRPKTDAEIADGRVGKAKAAWLSACAQRDLNGFKGDQTATPRVSTMLKMDETLKPRDPADDSRQVCPRIISTVEPSAHADEQVHIAQALKEALAEHWKEETFQIDGRFFKYIMGPALSVEELDKLMDAMDEAHPNCVVIVVAGDDSIIRLEDGTRMTADYSAYDSTQGRPVLETSNTKWMTAMGCPEKFIEFFKTVYETRYRIRTAKEEWTVEGVMAFQFMTGLAITTVSNSVNNAVALTYCILECGKDLSRAEELLKLMGFKPKINIYPDATGVDFLKGVYIPSTDGGHTWHPMPSRVLKLGKISKDPMILAKRSGHLTDTPIDAAKRAAASIAKGLQTSDRNCPIFGDLLRLYDALAPGADVYELNQVIEDAAYTQLKRVPRGIDPATWRQLFQDRYDITSDEIDSYRDLVDDIIKSRSFPVLIHHPAVEKLRAVDYA